MNGVGVALTAVSGATAIKSAKSIGSDVVNKAYASGEAAIADNVSTKIGSTLTNFNAGSAAKILETSGSSAKDILINGTKYVANGTDTLIKAGSNLTYTLSKSGQYVVSPMQTLVNGFKMTGLAFKSTNSFASALANVGKTATSGLIGTANVLGALGGKSFQAGLSMSGRNLFKNLASTACMATGAAAATAPLITTQIITRNIANENTDRLNKEIAILTDSQAYYDAAQANLTKDQQEFYENQQKERDEFHAGLLTKYQDYLDENGNFTNQQAKEAFTKEYTNYESDYADKLQNEMSGWSGYVDFVRNNGVANEIAGSMTEHNADVDKTRSDLDFVDTKLKENPDAETKAYEGEKINQELGNISTGNKFLDFIKSVHSTIIHYLPAVAYVEATAIKGADMLLGMLPFGYQEKHAEESITDLANSICNSAEAQRELEQERNAVVNSCDNASKADIDDFKSSDDNQKEDNNMEFAPA